MCMDVHVSMAMGIRHGQPAGGSRYQVPSTRYQVGIQMSTYQVSDTRYQVSETDLNIVRLHISIVRLHRFSVSSPWPKYACGLDILSASKKYHHISPVVILFPSFANMFSLISTCSGWSYEPTNGVHVHVKGFLTTRK